MGINSIQKEGSLNLFAGDMLTRQAGTDAANSKGQKEKSNTIFAGDLKGKQPDRITLRKEQAQKEALKVISDQFKSDLSISGSMEEREQQKIQLTEEAAEAGSQKQELENLREGLKESFGINDASEEEINLKLLQKNLNSPQSLTEEERVQLGSMGPVTDYQAGALAYAAAEKELQKQIEAAGNGIMNLNFSIESTKNALLKVHPMVDAQKAASSIMDEAGKEAIAMMQAEAKDHVDEVQKENEEKEEKLADKKEEEQKRIDGGENPSTEYANENKELQKAALSKDQLDEELKKILETSKLLEEDLKGAEVNILI